MRIIPLTLRQANYIVSVWHRHSKPLGSLMKYAVGLEDGGKIVGAAFMGRPISPSDSDGFTLEVKRLVTNGTKNACSMLYGACARSAKALGYAKLITFTLESESGISLRASNWVASKVTDGYSLHTDYATGERISVLGPSRIRWELVLCDPPTPPNPQEFDTPGKSKSAPLPYPLSNAGEVSTEARSVSNGEVPVQIGAPASILSKEVNL